MSALLICLLISASFFGCSSQKTASSATPDSYSATETTTQKVNANATDELEKNLDLTTAKTITLGSEVTAQDSCASVKDNIATISKAGTYVISGKSSDAQIVVNAGEKDDVYIVLSNAELTYSKGSPIYVKQAKNAYIVMLTGTTNSVTDTKNYQFDDTKGKEPDATIFSKCDLTIGGSGALTVKGNYADAVKSKDDLKITEGKITITAVANGIKGRDSVTIGGGTISIDSGNDGIKTTNTEDNDKGAISLDGGTIKIKSSGDGVQAQTDLTVNGANVDITSGGGTANAQKKSEWGGNTSEDTTISAKGLKATNNINIKKGTVTVNSADDSLHSNSKIQITDGTLTLKSGDDGIHADNTLTVSGGTINVKESYEGLEGQTIKISGGEISVVSSDDGFNASGGNDSSNNAGPGGGDPFASTDNGVIEITGGYIYINADGDGIDSNGSITMSGGTAIVDGPTANNNGALDYNSTFKMTGGLLVAAGSSGMTQAVSDSSSQYAISATIGSQNAKTLFSIQDSSGNEILTYSPAKQYSNVVVCSPDIKKGNTYDVYTGGSSKATSKNGLYTVGGYSGGTKYDSVTTSSIVSYIGSSGGMGGGPMGGGPNGFV